MSVGGIGAPYFLLQVPSERPRPSHAFFLPFDSGLGVELLLFAHEKSIGLRVDILDQLEDDDALTHYVLQYLE